MRWIKGLKRHKHNDNKPRFSGKWVFTFNDTRFATFDGAYAAARAAGVAHPSIGAELFDSAKAVAI